MPRKSRRSSDLSNSVSRNGSPPPLPLATLSFSQAARSRRRSRRCSHVLLARTKSGHTSCSAGPMKFHIRSKANLIPLLTGTRTCGKSYDTVRRCFAVCGAIVSFHHADLVESIDVVTHSPLHPERTAVPVVLHSWMRDVSSIRMFLGCSFVSLHFRVIVHNKTTASTKSTSRHRVPL